MFGFLKGHEYGNGWAQAWVQKSLPILSPICASYSLETLHAGAKLLQDV